MQNPHNKGKPTKYYLSKKTVRVLPKYYNYKYRMYKCYVKVVQPWLQFNC